MLVNPFIVLAHPIKTIKDAIEKPDFNTAFFIVLMPTVLLIVFNLIAGVPLDLFSIARHGALNYLSWVIASCVFYFFAFLVAGKKIKGKFLAIMCSLSYIWFFVSIMMIVSFLLLIGSPKLIALQNVLQKESLTQEEVRVLYNMLTEILKHCKTLRECTILVLTLVAICLQKRKRALSTILLSSDLFLELF